MHIDIYVYTALVEVNPRLSPEGAGRRLAFTRYCFTSKLYCGSQSSLYCPPHLQSLPYCNTITRPLRSIRPPTDPRMLMPYTIRDW